MRLTIIAIVPAVDIFDPVGQLIFVDVIERRDCYRHEWTASGQLVALREGTDTAFLAEAIMEVGMVAIGRRPFVAGEFALTLKDANGPSRSDGKPGPRLAADGAVAAKRSLNEIEGGFKTNRAAMAASGIGGLRH